MSDEKLEALTTFVMWKGEVLAFFRAYRRAGERDFTKTVPTLKNARLPAYMQYWAVDGYAHCGQHGEFDEAILRHCVKCGKVATPKEYGPLKKELEGNFDYVIIPHQYGRLRLRGKWYRNEGTAMRKEC